VKQRKDDPRVGGILGVVGTFLVVLSVTVGGSAHHRPNHAGGPSASSTAPVTEDNDDDGSPGHPNAPDPLADSDNQHPSGKDKHLEAGGSGNQGKTKADPDDGFNGGVDQPAPEGSGPGGGVDVLDQDGNNGCGNDDDFEDDNNGKCGKAKPSAAPSPSPTIPPVTQTTLPLGTQVAGVLVEADSGGDPRGGGGAVVAVGGARAIPVPVGAVEEGLAFTGATTWPLALIFLGLLLPGLVLLSIGRRRGADERAPV
jgi:hypothetical protein